MGCATLIHTLPLDAVFASHFNSELFHQRHLAFLSPPFFILLARLLITRRPRWAAILPGMALLALNIFSLQLTNAPATARQLFGIAQPPYQLPPD